MCTISVSSLYVSLLLMTLQLTCCTLGYRPTTFSRGFAGLSMPNFGSDNEDLPPFTVAPFDGAYFSWTATNTSGVWTMFGMFNFTNGEYLAIGLNSDKKMNGPIVICNANSSASSATCYDYIGSLYTIQMVADNAVPVSQQATTLLAASAGGVTLIQFSKVVYDPANSVSIVNMNGFNRMIFARGKWGSLPAPIQHQSDDSYSCEVNFVTGEVVTPASTSYRYVLYPGIALMVIVAVGIRIAVVCCGWRIPDRLRAFGAILLCGGFTAFIIAYIMVYYRDYLVMVSPKAFFRSVGQGAAAVFCCLLIPTSRRLFMSAIFDIPPERAIVYHMFCALLFMVITTIHGVGMWAQYGTSQIVRWRDKDTASRLPGLLAYVLCIVQVVVGMLRHRIGFLRFRVFHYLYVPIVFFVCCHATIVVYGIIPAASLMLLSNLYKRLFSRVGELEGVARAKSDHATETVVLDIVNYNITPPGSYYFLTIPALSRFSHPFSAFRTSTTSSGDQVIRFVVKSTVSRDLNIEKQWKPPAPDERFTQRLFDHIDRGLSIDQYRLDGPYGNFEHDPKLHDNFVLVAGGIGITAISGIMFSLADADDKMVGITATKTHLLLIWVVRSVDWVHLLGADLANARITMQRTCPHLRVTLKIFITNSAAAEGTKTSRSSDDKPIAPLVLEHLQLVFGRRPDLGEEFRTFEAQQNRFFITAPDGSFTTRGAAGVYCCGPESLTASVKAACSALTDLKVNMSVAAQYF